MPFPMVKKRGRQVDKSVDNFAAHGPFRTDGIYIYGRGIGGHAKTVEEYPIAMIRGWGHLSYLGEEEAIASQEANAKKIVEALNLLESVGGAMAHAAKQPLKPIATPEQRDKILGRAREIAQKIATETGSVTGARVLKALRDESFPGLDLVDPRILGQVFKGSGWEKMPGLSTEEGSHGRPVTVWRLAK